MQTAHDHLFRRLLARPAAAAALLRQFLPKRFTAAVDWRTLRPWPGRRIDRRLRAHLPDELLRALLRRRRTPVFFVPEHKSRGERFTALQTLRYELQIFSHAHQRRPGALLPLVVPIVFSHGRRFRAPRDLGQLIERSPVCLPQLRREWTILVVDFSTWPEARLLRAALPPFAKLVVLFAQYLARRSRRVVAGALRRWAPLLKELSRTPLGRDDLQALSSYILFTTDFPAAPLDRLLRQLVGRIGPIDMITTAERLRRQGRREGLERGLEKGLEKGLVKGLARGRAKGVKEGQVALLLSQLEERFGALDRATLQRVRRAPPAALVRWAKAILTARSLAAVFQGE